VRIGQWRAAWPVARVIGGIGSRDAVSASDALEEARAELNWSAVAAAEGDVAEAQRRFAVGTRALENLGVTLDPERPVGARVASRASQRTRPLDPRRPRAVRLFENSRKASRRSCVP
jgi:hypothetical protein